MEWWGVDVKNWLLGMVLLQAYVCISRTFAIIQDERSVCVGGCLILVTEARIHVCVCVW